MSDGPNIYVTKLIDGVHRMVKLGDQDPPPPRPMHPLHAAIVRMQQAAAEIGDSTGTGTEWINRKAVSMFAMAREAHAEAKKVLGEHAEMLEFLREDKAKHDRDCGAQENCIHRDRLDLLARVVIG